MNRSWFWLDLHNMQEQPNFPGDESTILSMMVYFWQDDEVKRVFELCNGKMAGYSLANFLSSTCGLPQCCVAPHAHVIVYIKLEQEKSSGFCSPCGLWDAAVACLQLVSSFSFFVV